MRRTSVCAVIILFAATALRGEGEDTERRDLALAFNLPRLLAENASRSRVMVVEAVYAATELSGGMAQGVVVSTGTLAPGPDGEWRWARTPSDRLVVKLGDETHEFVLGETRGNMEAATADAWLSSPHVLNYTHRMPGEAEAEVSVAFDGAAFEASVSGWAKLGDEKLTVSLKSAGRTGGVRDFHGADTKTTYDLGGTVKGKGFAIEVAERHTLTFVAANSVKWLRPSQRGSATSFTAAMASVLTRGETVYRLKDVAVQIDTRVKGGNTTVTMPTFTGQVQKGGAVLGHCVLAEGVPVLKTEAGVVSLAMPEE